MFEGIGDAELEAFDAALGIYIKDWEATVPEDRQQYHGPLQAAKSAHEKVIAEWRRRHRGGEKGGGDVQEG